MPCAAASAVPFHARLSLCALVLTLAACSDAGGAPPCDSTGSCVDADTVGPPDASTPRDSATPEDAAVTLPPFSTRRIVLPRRDQDELVRNVRVGAAFIEDDGPESWYDDASRTDTWAARMDHLRRFYGSRANGRLTIESIASATVEGTPPSCRDVPGTFLIPGTEVTFAYFRNTPCGTAAYGSHIAMAGIKNGYTHVHEFGHELGFHHAYKILHAGEGDTAFTPADSFDGDAPLSRLAAGSYAYGDYTSFMGRANAAMLPHQLYWVRFFEHDDLFVQPSRDEAVLLREVSSVVEADFLLRGEPLAALVRLPTGEVMQLSLIGRQSAFRSVGFFRHSAERDEASMVAAHIIADCDGCATRGSLIAAFRHRFIDETGIQVDVDAFGEDGMTATLRVDAVSTNPRCALPPTLTVATRVQDDRTVYVDVQLQNDNPEGCRPLHVFGQDAFLRDQPDFNVRDEGTDWQPDSARGDDALFLIWPGRSVTQSFRVRRATGAATSATLPLAIGPWPGLLLTAEFDTATPARSCTLTRDARSGDCGDWLTSAPSTP